MRSLAFKLSLAFVLVGLCGAALVAVIVGLRTRSAFDRFVLDRHQADVLAAFADYHAMNAGWTGIEAALRPAQGLRPGGRRDFLHDLSYLADGEGRILFGRGPFAVGQTLSEAEREEAIPVRVADQTVGWLRFGPPGGRGEAGPSPESLFLDRVRRGIAGAALGASALALVLGIGLARTIARPLRDLTAASAALAAGDLGRQVPVRSKDELGTLAQAFNQMSGDLARARDQRRRMTADIAHDLRTPLTVILGYTEALAEGKLQGNPEIHAQLHAEAQQLRRLVEDLRTLSLADAGELSLLPQAVAPATLLGRAEAAHRPLAAERGIRLALEIEPGLPAIRVDPERMAQVLGNLLANALRHTPAGGRIVLAAGRAVPLPPGESPAAAPTSSALMVNLRVSDSGEGIDPEDLPHIFERHYRADRARGRDAGASGLGLAIARSLVQACGGSIEASSRLGQGTTFTIRLPVAESDLLGASAGLSPDEEDPDGEDPAGAGPGRA